MSLPEWIRELKGQHIEVHEPYLNDDVCEDCEDLWPCDVYRLIEYIEQQDAENQRLREAAGKLRRDVAAEYVDAMPVTIHNALVDFDRATRTSDEG